MTHSSRAVKPPQRHWETLREREVVVVGGGEGGGESRWFTKRDRQTDRQKDRDRGRDRETDTGIER